MTETLQAVTARADGARRPVDEPTRRGLTYWGIALLTAVLVLVCVVSANAYSRTQPKIYGASAELIVEPRPDLSDAAADRAVLTSELILRSSIVLEPVARLVGVPLPELRAATTTEVVRGTNVLRITVADRDQGRAVRRTQAIVDEFVGATQAGSSSPAAGGPVRIAVLSGARPLEKLLHPQPLRAVAGGALTGLLLAAVVVAVVAARSRPRQPRPMVD